MRKFRILMAILLLFSLAIIIYFINEFVKYKFAATIVNTNASIDFAKLRNDGKIHIVIDAGHGGPDPGARNFKLNIFEKDIARKVVDAVMSMIDTNKYTVLETRPKDSNIHRHSRIDLANKFKTDLLISFHCNAFTGGYLNGVEIHLSDSSLNIKDSTSKANPHKKINMGFADTLSKNMAYVFPDMKRNGVVNRKDRIWIIYAGDFPSVLVEWGYINNEKDIAIMQDPVAHQVLARAVWHSINQHFGFEK